MEMDISEKIKQRAYELGYDMCGIIKAEEFTEYTQYLKLRVEKFPKSEELYKKLYDLSDPQKKAEWGKSVVVVVRRYNKYRIPKSLQKYYGKVYLFDGRLEHTREYKGKVLFEEYLKQLGMKTSQDGVTARWAAAKAGLGIFRKNNFIYTKFGSWVWIDTFIVDYEMKYDNPIVNEIQPCPENCRRCIDACPTKALSGEYSMDRGLCIAQLSFYSSELPSENIRESMGTWLYGCDICQEVCPMNKNKWDENEDFPELDKVIDLCESEKILEMDEETFRSIIYPRFWYISKDKLWLWKSSALRAMANSGEDKYFDLILSHCNDNDDRIKETAQWARKKLGL